MSQERRDAFVDFVFHRMEDCPDMAEICPYLKA